MFHRSVHAFTAALLLCALFLQPASALPAKSAEQAVVTFAVRYSPTATYETRLAVYHREIAKEIARARMQKADPHLYMTDLYVTVFRQNREQQFRLEYTGNLWNEAQSERLTLSKETSGKLLRYAEALRKRHYGKLISWDEVKRTVPRKSIFSVTDLETGLTFRVQHRAGRDHADVQPLTKEDTKIMKEIYNNRWSWNRKAILVQFGNQRYAASMNGMPHGGDGIPGNGFSGHFCIHFSGSTTHRSDRPDLAHQLMVHKAAGMLKTFFQSASPEQLTEIWKEAMQQKDIDMIRQLLEGVSPAQLASIERELSELTSIQFERLRHANKPGNDAAEEELLFKEIRFRATLYRKGSRAQQVTYRIIFERDSSQSPWRFRDVATVQTAKRK
ncbi:hypothetical protein PAE9249_03498 [Paenibacillus sp. CECT 9249]|uniref:hypothetical protein n=1 Tax=Paenibacillus sp. CECT 9249 TaxID=2845385 RepID=UPI001E4FB71F|nr:hypothetical protein [Paenibacillus sp. CECT 9249]CAH0120973.1 hypothetical protein PAE9249_03498 [Paenibacillus sp. CECT 9249]